ncbi:MAG: HupE/UreJ family protein, partial [Caldilineaceae bacterium]|nr:HupE/UreJ family protein [Caldilineaceae bacterium]
VLAHGLLSGTGLASGLLHPIGGWDHLLAMVAVGIISTKLGGRALWSLPLIFVASMAAGYLAGLWGISLLLTEWGVMLSVVVLGLQVALADGVNQKWTLGNGLIVMLFGLCHGYAHGVECPQQSSALWFASGFLLATIGLHVIGVILGLLWRQGSQPNRLFALAGSGIAVSGVVLIFLYSLRI